MPASIAGVTDPLPRFPALTRFRSFFVTGLLANRKAFEVATNMLVVISGEQRKMIHKEKAMKSENLESIAQKLVAPGKGILAADESSGTIEKRLKSINVPSTEENRRAYRELLFTTKGAGEFISGVILFDETIRQKTRDGHTFVEVLEQQGIIPGIKVDEGAKAMANFPREKITEGLDGLRDRLVEYRQLGARFAKWRAVIAIGDGIPSRTCIDSNAEALARYAALCQEGDLVPIVEPE